MLQFFERGERHGHGRAPCARLVDDAVRAHAARPLPRQLPRPRRRARDPAGVRGASAIRVEYFGDEIERITRFDPLRGDVARGGRPRRGLSAARTTSRRASDIERAIGSIQRRAAPSASTSWRREGKLLERQRLEQRTRFDLEMLKEIGYCHGIENYSRHLSGRAAGRAAADPARLLSRRTSC